MSNDNAPPLSGLSKTLRLEENAFKKLASPGWLGPSCTIGLANSGATIDYGTINRATLSAASDTLLPITTRSNAFTITCVNPTALTMTFSDNRYSSLGGNTQTTNSAGGGATSAGGDGAGLGLDASGHKIGGYTGTIGGPKVGGASMLWASVQNGSITSNWALVTPGATHVTSRTYAFTTDVTTNAVGRVFTANYSVAVNIAPTSTLDMTNDVVLDGSITMQVNYL